MTGPLTEQTIRKRGPLEITHDILDLIVAQRGGQLVRLGDVADVKDGSAEQRSWRCSTGWRGLASTSPRKSKGISTTRVSDEVLAQVDEKSRRRFHQPVGRSTW